MQGSIISPALFNIYIEDLINELISLCGIENVFGYADDIASISDNIKILTKCITSIEKFSISRIIPINYSKSGILNIKRTKKLKGLLEDNIISFLNFPIVKKYKYLGIWLDKTLILDTHLQLFQKKITFIENKIKIMPKTAVKPILFQNLWTLFIRPLFDYSIIYSYICNTNKALLKAIRMEKCSLKRTMGIRITTHNNEIESLLGYNPINFVTDLATTAKSRWEQRKKFDTLPNKLKNYKINSNTLTLTWECIKTNNLFHNIKCKTHKNITINISHLEKHPNFDNINKMLPKKIIDILN